MEKKLRIDSKEGGPYGISVGNFQTDQPDYFQEIAITFGARPEDEQRLLREAKEVIENLKKGNITKEMFQIAVNSLLPKHEKFTNKEIQKKLYTYSKSKTSRVSVEERRKYIQSLTFEEIIGYA